jgi:undecaprenyl-diphosphatase
VWPWAIGTSYLLTGLVLLQTAWPVLPLPVKLDRSATEVTGWDAVGLKAGEVRKAMPDPSRTFLFGLRYQIASELAFYIPGQPETVSINRWDRPNVYDYWWEDADLLGWDAVGVSRSPDLAERLKEVFVRVEGPEEIPVYRSSSWPSQEADGEPVRLLYLYRGYDFKGGLRWHPRDTHDVRAG